MPFKDESGILKRIRAITNSPSASKQAEIEERLRQQAAPKSQRQARELIEGGFKQATGASAVKRAIERFMGKKK